MSIFKTYRNLNNQVIKTAKKLYFKKQLTINKKSYVKPGKFFFPLSIKKNKKKTTGPT